MPRFRGSEDVLGILLQETKVEVWVLQAMFHECNLGESCNSDDNNRPMAERLAREKEALRRELTAPSSPLRL